MYQKHNFGNPDPDIQPYASLSLQNSTFNPSPILNRNKVRQRYKDNFVENSIQQLVTRKTFLNPYSPSIFAKVIKDGITLQQMHSC